jgi:signal transduction histidine kinase
VHDEVRSKGGRVCNVVGISAGRTGTAVLMLEDVTARARRAEAQREFVANAAHELLTPLTGIVGAAHVLESGGKVDPSTRDRFIAHIAHECDRLARVARSLLVLARARSGEEPPRPESVPLRPLLEAAIEAAGADDLARVQCDDGVDVFVDRDLAEQALANLIANAKRHAPGEPILVTVGEGRDRAVAVEIVDHGGGMTPDQLDRLERRFASGAGRDSMGFGLGVSIAAQALEAIDGTLSFESSPGIGTRARVELPSATVAAR